MDRSTGMQLALARTLRVSALVAGYIKMQRRKFVSQGHPLTNEQRAAMSAFFPAQVLETVRVIVLEGVRLRNPPFHRTLKRLSFSGLRELSQVSAITFDNVIVSHQQFTDALLFHELVHVEQYRQLGIRRFSELYVRGFLLGGGYEGIPLELNAYELGERFEANPQEPFSVAEEVRRWIMESKF